MLAPFKQKYGRSLIKQGQLRKELILRLIPLCFQGGPVVEARVLKPKQQSASVISARGAMPLPPPPPRPLQRFSALSAPPPIIFVFHGSKHFQNDKDSSCYPPRPPGRPGCPWRNRRQLANSDSRRRLPPDVFRHQRRCNAHRLPGPTATQCQRRRRQCRKQQRGFLAQVCSSSPLSCAQRQISAAARSLSLAVAVAAAAWTIIRSPQHDHSVVS
jgi:hypothetical protein